MILQIHDELIFDVTGEEVETMKALVKDQMENVVSLSVPIKVDLGVGLNWAEVHS
jgi:DNA polymerase-1